MEELKALGVEDARVDEHCYVYGSLPATPGCEDKPALGLIAHMDTAPDASGENVNPILHENYDGSDVTLPATGMVMKVSAFPFLASMKGETLITTDGTTLLGADDKAGVAEIMTAVETVLEKGLPHGKLCIAFTPDEEIGEGASLFDIPGFGADFAYTVDGGDAGSVEYENFNAAAATVTIHGFSVHPGSAKDTMINASNVAMEFHGALPVMARPETTEGRQGFYHLCQMYGDVTTAKLGYILRDHDAAKLQFKKDNLLDIAAYLNGKYGDGTVEVEIKDSYRNMLEKIKPHFHLVETARKAIRMAGLEPEEVPVRGGTDGATLGFFQVTLSCEEEIRNPKDKRVHRVKLKAIKFKADKELKGELCHMKFQRSKIRPHSANLSEVEIDMKLTEYFAENQIITRKDFQYLCGMTQITAYRHIKRLMAEKKLQNKGTIYQPIYTPVPGNYRVSVDLKYKER